MQLTTTNKMWTCGKHCSLKKTEYFISVGFIARLSHWIAWLCTCSVIVCGYSCGCNWWACISLVSCRHEEHEMALSLRGEIWGQMGLKSWSQTSCSVFSPAWHHVAPSWWAENCQSQILLLEQQEVEETQTVVKEVAFFIFVIGKICPLETVKLQAS